MASARPAACAGCVARALGAPSAAAAGAVRATVVPAAARRAVTRSARPTTAQRWSRSGAAPSLPAQRASVAMGFRRAVSSSAPPPPPLAVAAAAAAAAEGGVGRPQCLRAHSRAATDASAGTPPVAAAPVAAVAVDARPPDAAADADTLFRRPLPSPPAVAFSSPEGRRLFAEALGEGGMDGFFALAEQFATQQEPAFCGLASLTMVLNSLAVDPGRVWKGRWRWYHEQHLDCCVPLEQVKEKGVNFDELAALARCNGLECTATRAEESSVDEFRRTVEQVVKRSELRLVVSYSRQTLAQTGDGHFTPLGGYHRGRDLVLLLDVARFKYPPHWVPLPLLFAAMSARDASTRRSRGWLLLRSAGPAAVIHALQLARAHGGGGGAGGEAAAAAAAAAAKPSGP